MHQVAQVAYSVTRYSTVTSCWL